MAPSHVLVPLDGSPLAREAFAHTLETFDCHVTVVNVVTPVDAGMSEGHVLDPGDDRLADARDRAERVIDEASVEAAARDREIDTAVVTGDPAETIVDFVEANDVDHVVMGGHGGSGGDLSSRLLGTVATSVVAEAPVTVTVVR